MVKADGRDLTHVCAATDECILVERALCLYEHQDLILLAIMPVGVMHSLSIRSERDVQFFSDVLLGGTANTVFATQYRRTLCSTP